MRRLSILVAGLALAGAACSSTAQLPLTRASDPGTGAQTVDPPVQAGRPVTLAPLDVRLTPDVLVRAGAPLDAALGQKLTGLVTAGHANVFRTARLPFTGPNGAENVSVAGVDPVSFRRFMPEKTAEVTPVWENVANWSVAMSYEAARRLNTSLGATVTIAGIPLLVGALADTGLPDVDAVVADGVASRLGLPPPNAVLLAGGANDPTPLAMAVRKAVPKSVRVDLVRSPAQHLAFFNGSQAARQFGTLSYLVNPDGKVDVDPNWVAKSIVTQSVPIIGRMTCNRLMFPQLIGALNEIVAAGLADAIHPGQYEGCYWPKLIEDSDHLSMHAWGLAFDINVPTNQRMTHGDQDPRMVAIFKKWGFRWGGDWKGTPDPMHFELASLLASAPK